MLPIIKLKENAVVFEEGKHDSAMFIVLEGRIRLYVIRHGKEVELSTVERNEFFGEIEMFKKRPRSVSAKAITTTRLAVIKTRLQLEQFMNENPTFPGKMARLMGQRLAKANAEL